MNNDLISRKVLKEDLFIKFGNQLPNGLFEEHDKAPTVEYPFYREAYQSGYEEGKNERPQGEWITDRVPSYTGLCLISIDALVTVANFDGTAFRDRDSSEEITINAWQPLPEPYKKGGTE